MVNDIIFTPGKIGNMALKNRIIMSAMHLGYGFQQLEDFYIKRAKGGVSAVTLVAGVTPEGTYRNMILLDEQNMKNIQRLACKLHQYDCKLIIQLFCAGRNGRKGELYDEAAEPLAPSPIPSPIYKYVPREMDEKDIRKTVEHFGQAARRCMESGVDCVEISCSAGYLLSQFISTLTNKREDNYGGDFNNRIRFPLEVIAAVRKQTENKIAVLLRISGGDMLGGYDLADMKEFVRVIPEGLIDGINVTGGWHESKMPQIDTHLPKGGWAILASQIKRVTKLPVIACNRINDEETIYGILSKSMADFVGCARGNLVDCELVNKIKEQKPYVKCIGCNKGCIERIIKMKPVECVLNPEITISNSETQRNKKVLVIGGGPAGLTSAKELAQVGNRVTLCTDQRKLGGHVNLASKPSEKKDLHSLIDSLSQDLISLGVKIVTDNKVMAEDILDDYFDYDFVVVATGGKPRRLGINNANIIPAEEILLADGNTIQQMVSKEVVIVGGGLVGMETAKYIVENTLLSEEILRVIENYNQDGRLGSFYQYPHITIVEQDEIIGREYGGTRRFFLADLKKYHVKFVTNSTVTAYDGSVLSLRQQSGSKVKIKADIVIEAIGYVETGEEIVDLLQLRKIPHKVVGDASGASNIKNAIITAKSVI